MAGELDAPAAAKAALRREILAARDALPAVAHNAASHKITQQILTLDAWKNARCVLLYMSFGSEFDSAALRAAAAAGGKQLCLPRVDRERRALVIHTVSDAAHTLQPGPFGIHEPQPHCARADLNAIDFVLVPGVAFTPACHRLGYGGGYYDRLIAGFEMRPPLIAAAFALQLRDDIPRAAHDCAVDLVVTEDNAYCGC